MPEQEQEQEADDDLDDDDLADGCCVPEDEMIVCRDLNLDYPWKGGNQYSRICPECGARTFTAKSYWVSRVEDPEQQAHVIPKDSDEPEPYFLCPYEGCDGRFHGYPDECPECEQPFEWEGLDDDGETDTTEDADN